MSQTHSTTFDTDRIKISGPYIDQGAFDRAVMVARDRWERGQWDGVTPIVIDDPYRAYLELERQQTAMTKQTIIQPDSALTTSAALSTDRAPDHPVLAYLASLGSKRTQRTMLSDLARIAAVWLAIPDGEYFALAPAARRRLVLDVPWQTLRKPHTDAIRAKLMNLDYSPGTANRMLAALRGVLKKCWEQELISAEDYHRARSVEAVKGSRQPAGRDLQYVERQALFEVCSNDPTPAGARDAAILACADAGLRRAEIAGLDVDSYNLDTHKLHVRGKGNKDRTVPIVSDGMRQALADWLAVRGMEAGPLFWPINKAGKITPRRMTHQAIYNVLKKRGAEAKTKDFTPHDLRRTLVGDLLDAGADISTVQKIMGHANPATTARYDRRSARAQEQAMGLRNTPYKGRTQQPLPDKGA